MATAPGLSRLATTLLVDRLRRFAQPPDDTRGVLPRTQDKKRITERFVAIPLSHTGQAVVRPAEPAPTAAFKAERPGLVAEEAGGLESGAHLQSADSAPVGEGASWRS